MSEISNNNAKPESSASFGIYGIEIDLVAITNQLGIAPSHTHRVGDLDMLGETLPHNMWLLNSPLDRTEPVDAHLRWLAEQLKPHYKYLKSLKASAEMKIYCGYITDSDQCGFSISPSALSVFVELGISMDFSVIFIGDD